MLWQPEQRFARARVPYAIAIVLLALAWRLSLFIGPSVRDDVMYADAAHRILNGSFVAGVGDNVFADRLGVVLPVVVGWKLLGITPFSTALYPLVCGIGTIVVATWLALHLFGEAEALVTASILAFVPLDTMFSTQLMPDVPMAWWMTLSIALALKGSSRLCWLASGATLGVAALTKEFAIVGAPLILAIIATRGRRAVTLSLTRCLLVAAGALFVLGLQAGWYGIHGSPLHYFQVVLANAARAKNGNPDSYAYFKYLFNGYVELNWFGWLYYAATVSAVLLVVVDFRNSWFAIVWGAAIFVFLQWIGPWLSGRTEIERMERFLIPLSVPAVLWVARASAIVATRLRLQAVSAVVAAVIIASMIGATFSRAYAREYASVYDLRILSQLVPMLAPHPIIADRWTADKVEMLTGYRVRLDGYDAIAQPYPIVTQPSWVIVDGAGDLTLRHGSKPAPLHWQRVLEVQGPRYDIYGRFNPVLYWADDSRKP